MLSKITSIDTINLPTSIKAELLEDHGKGLAISLVGNLLNIAAISYIFFSALSPLASLIGYSSIGVILLHRAHIVKLIKKMPHNDEKTVNSIWKLLCLNTTFYGLWWAVSLYYTMSISQTFQQIIIVACGAGMMSGVSIAYRMIAPASKIALTTVSIGCISALLSADSHIANVTSILLGSYYLVLMRHAGGTSDNIVKRMLREREIKQSSETINMLLADFTEQGSDWLIEMSQDGEVFNPCERMAEASCRQIETMQNLNLFALIDDNIEADELKDHLINGRPIRKHIVSLTIDGEQKWWSISARLTDIKNIDDHEDSKDTSKHLYRGVVSDITAQRHAEEKVNYMAHFDALTDLPNRFQFNQRLFHTLKNKDQSVGLMYLDLDNFKSINDTLGHVVGDQLLQAAARRLESCARSKDIVARLGGDEFAIIIDNGTEDTLNHISDRIIEELSRPFQIDGHDVVIGTSIGIAIAPQDGSEPDVLLRNADLALYSAKSNGRNRAIRYQIGMDEAAQFRRVLEMDMRGALSKNEMRLHYQPIVDLDTNKTSGYEALIRWEHPERGIVMPDEFIPVAEETGLIVQLGEWVIRKAMDDMVEWPNHLNASINLSPAQMRSPSLISTIVNSLARTGIEPSRVCLEITETVLMKDSEVNLATLHKLRSIGLKIALDDFGTGYSSLNYLRSFPFDKIKIDRCFVDEIDSRQDCQAIIKSVVGLANSLGISTTAEGVERNEQLEYLKDRGCIEAQGYLYSKAVPQNELSNLRVRSEAVADRLVKIEEKRKAKKLEVSEKDSDNFKLANG